MKNVLDHLMRLNRPFIIRTPKSTMINRPSWYTPKLENKFIIEMYDHEKHDMWIGSGKTLELAFRDLQEAFSDKGTVRQEDLPVQL